MDWDTPRQSDDPFENDVMLDRRPTTRANMVSIAFRGVSGGRVSIPVANLALELAMFGDDPARVADAWGISPSVLERTLRTTPLLARMVEDYKKELSDNGRLRTQAKDLLTSALPRLQDLIFNAVTAPKDVINAIELLGRLADAMPKTAPAAVGTGTVLNFNITNRQAAAEAATPIVLDGISSSVVDIELMDESGVPRFAGPVFEDDA